MVRWATDTLHVKEVLIIPCMNRLDRYGFTREDDMAISHRFNTTRRLLNAQLRAAVAKMPGVKMANETDSPNMFSDTAPSDTSRFADLVHPKDAGAKELGEGILAHGLRLFSRLPF